MDRPLPWLGLLTAVGGAVVGPVVVGGGAVATLSISIDVESGTEPGLPGASVRGAGSATPDSPRLVAGLGVRESPERPPADS